MGLTFSVGENVLRFISSIAQRQMELVTLNIMFSVHRAKVWVV